MMEKSSPGLIFMSNPTSTLTASDALQGSRYVTRNPEILQGEPIVAGTQVAVRDVVVLWQSGVRPEEIPQALYDLVSIAQVFDALSFYYDAKEEIDERIAFYQSHPSPLSRLNPLWDNVIENIADYHRGIDVEADLSA
jgi:uncharacterized protein (DUF433 family)